MIVSDPLKGLLTILGENRPVTVTSQQTLKQSRVGRDVVNDQDRGSSRRYAMRAVVGHERNDFLRCLL